MLRELMETHPPAPSPSLSTEMLKYLKPFDHLENVQGVLCRNFLVTLANPFPGDVLYLHVYAWKYSIVFTTAN